MLCRCWPSPAHVTSRYAWSGQALLSSVMTACKCEVAVISGSIAPPPLLNWSIIVNTPAAHLPTMGGPMKVHAARPTCRADSRKNQAHLQVSGILYMAQWCIAAMDMTTKPWGYSGCSAQGHLHSMLRITEGYGRLSGAGSCVRICQQYQAHSAIVYDCKPFPTACGASSLQVCVSRGCDATARRTARAWPFR